MNGSTGTHPSTDPAASLIRQQLEISLPPGWSFDSADVDTGIGVLKVSLNDYFNAGGVWEKCALWVLALAEAIAELSVALSCEIDDIPKGGTVSRHGFFLAAVLVCNACHGKGHHGRPCSYVKIGNFPDRDRQPIRDLYATVYKESGLPGT